MVNFSKNKETNDIVNGVKPIPFSPYLHSDSENDDEQNALTRLNNEMSSQSPSSNQNSDIDDLFSSAKDRLNESQSGGISKEQLDSLHKHEGVNMWTSLFMNLIGSSAGLDSKKFTAPLEQRVENERQGLNLQNQLAQQQFQKAQGLQNFGLGQMKVDQEVAAQKYANQPIDKIKLATIGAYMKQAGQGENFNIDEYSNMTNAQADKLIPELYKLATNQTSLEKAKETAGLGRWFTIPNEKGDPSLFNPVKGEKITPYPTVERDPNKEYTYNDITSGNAGMNKEQRASFLKLFKPLAAEAAKITQQGNEYTSAVDSLRAETNQALNGNPIAAQTLPDRQAQVLGNMKGTLTNMQVQMQKDKASTGIINQFQSQVNKFLGKGSLTPQDAQNILKLADDIEAKRQEYFSKQRDSIRERAKGIAGEGNWNFDQALFGSNQNKVSNPLNLPGVKTSEEASQPAQAPAQNRPAVKMFSDPDEYLKHLGGK